MYEKRICVEQFRVFEKNLNRKGVLDTSLLIFIIELISTDVRTFNLYAIALRIQLTYNLLAFDRLIMRKNKLYSESFYIF